jgi:hypothetical protein
VLRKPLPKKMTKGAQTTSSRSTERQSALWWGQLVQGLRRKLSPLRVRTAEQKVRTW